MNQYQNQYGTIFAVKEHNGAPAIMCRAELSETWSLSSMIEPFTPGAWTVEELQAQLDNWAAVKGWQPVEDPAGCETREIVDDEEEEIRATDFCKCRTCKCESCFAHGCAKECPANAEESCLTVNCPEYIEKAIENPTAAAVDVPPCAPIASDAPPSPCQSADAGAKTGAEESVENPTPAAPASRADAGAAEQSPSAAGPASLEAPLSASSAFDYTGLDDQTVQDLHLAEREFACGKRMAEIGLRRMADGVAIAHDALCVTIATKCRNGNGAFSDSEKTFGRWCESVGLNRKAAERLLQVSKLFDNSTPREQGVLEELGPSLLYAAAKPSAPAELVQAVRDGDITTHKQYQALLAQYNAERAARERAEQEREEAVTHIRAARDMQIDTARERDTALKQRDQARAELNKAQAERADTLRLAAEAEKQRDGAREAARAAEAENDELRRKLQQAETRPIEVAVAQPGEAQIEAWRQEGADRCAAALQDAVQKAHKGMVEAQNHAADLEDQLAEARPDADACQRTVDTIFETIESLRGLLRTQLRAAQLAPAVYGSVVGHLLQAAQNLQNTVRDCAPAGYTMNDDEEDFL